MVGDTTVTGVTKDYEAAFLGFAKAISRLFAFFPILSLIFLLGGGRGSSRWWGVLFCVRGC